MYAKFIAAGIGIETIIRKSDMMFIPVDEENTYYQEYLAWVAEGNTPEPWEGSE